MKKIIYGIACILIIIMFTLNIFSAFNLSFFGFRVFRVGSGSMEPYLKVNDFIIIKESTEYKIEDVVTVCINNQYVTHRIISIDGEQIITKGDANNTEDEPIEQKDIVGKVIYKFGGINFINYLFSKPLSWIMLFFIGLFVTISIPEKRKKGKHAK